MSDLGVKYRGTGFVVLLDPETDLERARHFAPVLERMVEILGAKGNEHVIFADAMQRASCETKISVPLYMYEPLMRVAFQVIGSGRIPGAPDA